MVRIAVLYPRHKDKSFNLDYYKNNHMKLVQEKLNPLGMVNAELDTGIDGLDNSPSPFFAIAYLIFETAESFKSAFAKVGKDLLDDIPNYTDVEPILQISDYKKI